MHIHRFPLAAAGALVVALAAVGCGRQNEAGDTAVSNSDLQPAITTLDDDRIVAAIRSDFFVSDDVKAQNIDVSSERGVVTLAGTVPTEQARAHAVSMARQVSGVSRVDDRLQVRAAAASSTAATARDQDQDNPGWVTTKILAQYYLNPGLKPWNIDVTTSQDGVVTLEGRVDNDADRSEAVRIARSVDGVKDIRDRLRAGDVAATSGTTAGTPAASAGSSAVAKAEGLAGDVSDGWITTKIQSRFFLDPDVRGRDIDVNTSNGIVTLRGSVGSYSERRQAVGMARNTDGVRQVHDELRVEPGRAAAGTAPSRDTSPGNDVSDAWITTKIQSKYFIDDVVQGSQVDVNTRNGDVTLTGTVGSREARDAAVQLARDTDGVRNVRDRLTITPATDPPH